MPTEILLPIIVAIAGLCLGSMVSLVSYRLPRGMPVTFGRSQCMACNTPLGCRDLFPLISWLTSGGKCRHCQAKIGARYPLIELATMVMILAVYWQYGLTPQAGILALLSVCLMIMIVVDFEHYLIPDVIQLLLVALAVIYHSVIVQTPLVTMLTGALTGALTGFALQIGYRILRKKEGLGTGDVKFLVVAGLWLGAYNLVPFFFFSGLCGVAVALLWRALGKGTVFPFGPALALALWLLVVFPQTGAMFWNVMRTGIFETNLSSPSNY